MPLTSPYPFGERILTIGAYGVGKSFAALKWAQATVAAGHHVYITDTERAWARMLYGKGLQEGQDYTLLLAHDYEAFQRAVEHTSDHATKGDLAILDKAGDLWAFSQTEYLTRVKQTTRGEYYVEEAKAGRFNKFGMPKEMNWQVINALHDQLMQPLMMYSEADVYLTASATELIETESRSVSSKQQRAIYGRVGVKAKAQAAVSFLADTVLLFEARSGNKWVATSLKDRERELLDEEEFGDFVLDYLNAIAGWSLK